MLLLVYLKVLTHCCCHVLYLKLHTSRNKRKGHHIVSLGSIILGVWLISVLKCYHSWLQSSEERCRCCRRDDCSRCEIRYIYFFPFRIQKEGLKIKCRSSAFIHYKFLYINHRATVTGPGFQLWIGKVKGLRKWTIIQVPFENKRQCVYI